MPLDPSELFFSRDFIKTGRRKGCFTSLHNEAQIMCAGNSQQRFGSPSLDKPNYHTSLCSRVLGLGGVSIWDNGKENGNYYSGLYKGYI